MWKDEEFKEIHGWKKKEAEESWEKKRNEEEKEGKEGKEKGEEKSGKWKKKKWIVLWYFWPLGHVLPSFFLQLYIYYRLWNDVYNII